MKALRVLRLVRQKEHDNDEVKYSDYDIREAINEVLRYINVSLANKGSEYLQTVKVFDQNELNAEMVDEYEEEDFTLELYECEEELFESKAPIYANTQLKQYDFATTGVELPNDYVSLVDIQRICDGYHLRPATSWSEVSSPYGENKYIVLGGKIYVKGESFRLCYNRMIPQVSDLMEGSIDLPDIYLDPIVKLTRLVLNNADVDTMTQAVNTAVERAIPRRRYVNERQRMPFYL